MDDKTIRQVFNIDKAVERHKTKLLNIGKKPTH